MWAVAARRITTMMTAWQKLLHQRVEEEARGARLLLDFVEEEEVEEQL